VRRFLVMNKINQQLDTIDVEAKLKAFIRYLVTNFPQCGLLSRQIGEVHHVFVIKPYGGGPGKTIQVDRGLLTEPARSIRDFECCLSKLDLPRLLQKHERCELRCVSRPHPTQAGENLNEDRSAAPAPGGVLCGFSSLESFSPRAPTAPCLTLSG
jgi:hypothetical protein